MSRILIADDEKSIVDGLSLVLKDYQPETALNKVQAKKILNESTIDLLICDLYFPDIEDGLSLIKETKEISPDTFIVVFTGYGSIETAVQAIKAGADDYLTKNISPEELKLKIARFLEFARERRQLDHFRTLTQAISETASKYELIGKSAIMMEIKKKIERAGREGQVSVLLTGETGTGKEVCTRIIHNLSSRRNQPFLAIDCPTIPENLFESELFGYEKGAFTDARQRKIGKIELAHQGTLFLDEIADLPLNLQPKLLRFLETGEFFRLGGTRSIRVDTRIIASTNQNLEELIKAKKFREDLYFRLKVFVIELPPLRERKEDIPLLTEYFLGILDPLGKKRGLFSDRILNSLNQYHWPGNIRELRNIIEYLLITGNEEEIMRILSKNFSSGHIRSTTDIQSIPDHLPITIGSLAYKEAKRQALKEFERLYITQILEQENYNITRAAQKMGISREELHRKIKRLGIKTP